MEIYLTNSQHGKKISYFQAEADLDKRNGWKEVSKDEYYGVTPTLKAVEKKKPGPKPKNTLNGNSNTTD